MPAVPAPKEPELEKYLTVKSTIAAIADATGLASAITIYIQTRDRKDDPDLRHADLIERLALANVILLGVAFLIISVTAVLHTKPTGTARGLDLRSIRRGSASLQCSLWTHYILGALAIATTIMALILAAVAGNKIKADGTLDTNTTTTTTMTTTTTTT